MRLDILSSMLLFITSHHHVFVATIRNIHEIHGKSREKTNTGNVSQTVTTPSALLNNLYGCETRSLTLREEYLLLVF